MAIDQLYEMKKISVYLSLADEVDTTPFIQHCWEQGIETYVPVLEKGIHGPHVTFRLYEKHSSLTVLASGVRYPSSGEECRLEDLDAILVPGLYFTPGGKRLGRGMGFYDRLLENYAGQSLSLCFDEQIKADLPSEDHDVLIDLLICESS